MWQETGILSSPRGDQAAVPDAALAHTLPRVQEGPAFPLAHHRLLFPSFLIVSH